MDNRFRDKVGSTEETIDGVYVRDTRTPDLLNTFIRIRMPQDIDKISSYTCEDAIVDFDEDGNILGINVSFFRNLE